MFERYLSDALTTYFGSFVENLDANKVRLSAWRGSLVLSDLVIRPNALDLLVGGDEKCPVEIAYGSIGNLELSIPWKSVLKWSSTSTTESSNMNLECCVVLSDVHILVTPKKKKRRRRTTSEDDNELSVEEERSIKQQLVQRLLDAQLFERVAKSSTTTVSTESSSSRWQWARELVQTLLSNLSVTIRNIHLRYEDSGRGFATTRRPASRESFAVGITLQQFSVQTIMGDGATGEQEESKEESEHVVDEQQEDSGNDDKDTPTKEQQDESLPYVIRHKLAAAHQLAVYWDRGRGCHLMTANVSNHDDNDDGDLLLPLHDASPESKRLQEQRYYASAFGVLNGDTDAEEFRHFHLYNVPHAFVLSPVSPSMEFALVTRTNVDNETDSKDALIPPCTMNMTCPPCCLTISANTLEDTAYLRKSLAIWSRTRKSSISEASVHRLTGLRPSSSPLEDAQSWWNYAVEATLVLERKDHGSSSKRRRRGWAGLARAIQMRRRYAGLYETVLTADKESEREAAHVDLIQMEDDLLLEEIVAFRLAVYCIITKPSHLDDATVSEAASGQTWSEWVRGKKEEKPVVVTETFSESEHVPLEEDVGAQLSLDHRRRMYLEMTQMLQREESNQVMESSFRIADGSGLSTTLTEDPSANDVVWKTCMAFKELSLQVNERIASKSRGYQLRPVVRLSCAAIQHQTLYRDDSWEVDGAVASLQVVDLTRDVSRTSERAFPVLVARKSGSSSMEVDESVDSVVVIAGAMHPLSASVSVRRTIERDSDTDIGREAMSQTTTRSVIRLMPLEVVYSTNPIAALARALSTMKTPELTDDYHRMASVMSQWRHRQKGRLLSALAHRRKKIVVDVDISAPVVLIPENPNKNDSPLLVVDLGRLRFSNTDESIEDDVEYDDKWQLALDEVQVQCSSTRSYRMKREMRSMETTAGSLGAEKLIEPFSLHFIITTRIANGEAPSLSAGGTVLSVYATLPRLVFNLKSSAVRLVERLKLQWAQRAHGVTQSPTASDGHENTTVTNAPTRLTTQQTTTSPLPRVGRRIKFCFSAPLIGFRLDNDVDGRDMPEPLDTEEFSSSTNQCRSCPLVDLALREIRGEFVQSIASGTESTSSFDACLKSVTAVDLYQKAGEDFAFLLSSLPPSTFPGLPTTILEEQVYEDADVSFGSESKYLVSVQYVGSIVSQEIDHSSSKSKEKRLKDTLSITFNELYVEWNPETIAAIHKGMMLPKAVDETASNEGVVHSVSGPNLDVSGIGGGGESNDEFYDAIEVDDSSSKGDEEDSVQLISEISSRVSSFSEAAELAPSALNLGGPVTSSPFLNSGKSPSLLAGGIRPLVSSLTSSTRVRDHSQTSNARSDAITITTTFHVRFKLSALRVHFNKDSRHRRVLTAEMEDTDVYYVLEQSGSSKTKARIGNLSFVDPSCTTNSTLYKEILGLKCDSFGKEKATSLLEMDVSMNPRTRRVVSSEEDFSDDSANPAVSIDCRNGTVRGADVSVSLRLSPMRFVYIQQLWLEIIDYFFEAIVGYEVWGKQRPSLDPDPSEANLKDDQQHDGSRLHSVALRSDLPGLLAEEFSFTRFDVRMDEPMILIPVSYQSPHFLRLEFSSLAASNHYAGTVVGATNIAKGGVGVPEERAQWYNNCDVELNDLRLTSWEGSEIVASSAESDSESSSRVATNARIRVNWPVGQFALSVVPKWKVDCDIDRMILTLRRESYALLQHIIVHNIGELSRHLEEWDALQTLPSSELESYKKEIMVHFGYDKKDAAPTTYAVSVKVPSIRFFFLGPDAASDVAMEANCSLVEWQMRKLLDRIGRQQVTCDIALTKPGGRDGSGETDVDLLLPVEDSASYVPANRQGLGVDATPRELTYTSTSRPSGDNVRTLEIVNACIFAVYPAWMNVKRFFSNLPEPDFMNPDEVGLAMQIGDRWYRIGGNTASSSSSSRNVGKDGRANEREQAAMPSYQFRLLLKSPRIVLPSESTTMENTCVVLRMSHFDFFHHNDAHSRKITKTFFIHELGLYTSSIALLNRDGYIEENSLIRPWCMAGLHERCDCRVSGPCDGHALHVKADVLQARAAYSDMSVAIDVALRFLADLQQEAQSRAVPKDDAPSMIAEEEARDTVSGDSSSRMAAMPCEVPGKRLLSMELDGFELHVIDDSMRHFADAQQLIKFELQEVACYQVVVQQDGHVARREKRTKLSLRRINIFDCLQPQLSPFRLVASSGQSRSETSLYGVSEVETSEASAVMAWLDFRTSVDSQWGFCVSRVLAESVQSQGLLAFCDVTDVDATSTLSSEIVPQSTADLVELHHVFVKGVSDEYAVNLRPITLQWNPSTVIALQRFLGRLHKEARTKSEREWVMPSTSSNTSLAASDAIPTRARFQIDHLTVLLNKEHQHRCLVEATLSDSSASIELDAGRGMLVEGSIKDLTAWDIDASTARGQGAILEDNRRIFQVIASDGSSATGNASDDNEFLRFRFKTFAGTGPLTPDELPSWVSSRLGGPGSSRSAIDDYLSVSIATLRVCYIRERTEEIVDYLSNGLPGKGMGATSRAAKGFINKRIQTKSYLELDIRAPQVYVPQHEETYRGILVHVGDVSARSWFEEDAEESKQSKASQAVWYRVLSISLTGLRWNANERNGSLKVENDSAYAVPLDLKLLLRKPTKKGNAVVIRGSLSCIELTLAYTTFVLLKAVMRDNVSREIDVTRWDNVEKAYWLEVNEDEQPAYSSNARFIRYGKERRQRAATMETDPGAEIEPKGSKESQKVSPSVPTLDCEFKMDGLRLKLHRNDHLEGLKSNMDSAFCYDVVVLRADTIEVSLTANSVGDKSLQLSLSRLGVFDLGDTGRLARTRYYETLMELDSSSSAVEMSPRVTRNPCAFSVLVEGYSPTEDHVGSPEQKEGTAAEPQLLLTVDTCSSSSTGLENVESIPSREDESDKIVLARMVFNYMSVNALIRPLREIVAFLTCSWPLPSADHRSSVGEAVDSIDEKVETSVDQLEERAAPTSFRKGLQLKVVAHYPRIFFLADESDPCSRALVLRGLVVLDASIVEQETIVDTDNLSGQDLKYDLSHGFSDKKVVTAVNAQFHSMETYINPNVEDVLGLTRHSADVFDQNIASGGSPGVDDENADNRLLGVALIQPVTAGIEFCRIGRIRFPTLESFSVNMESVSTILSFEDLTLLEAILERWSPKAVNTNTIPLDCSSSHLDMGQSSMGVASPSSLESADAMGREAQTLNFDVTFQTDRLGLVLKKVSGDIVVERMQIADDSETVQAGDVLTAIEGILVESPSLDEVVEVLASASRPVTLSFSRKMSAFPSIDVTSSSFGLSRSFSRSHEESVDGDSVDAVANEGFSDEDEKCLPDVYTVTLRRGMLNGLTVEPSPCGGLPVVVDVLPSFFLNAVAVVDESSGSLEVRNTLSARLPRTGAVVAEIDGKPSSEVGYLETKELLDSLSSKLSDADKFRLSFDSDTTFCVKFLELNSSEWGKIRTADVAIAGIALTFIDDFKGRDMPLLRGKLDGIDVHIERGLGIDPRAVVAPPPDVLDLAENGVDSRDEITMARALFQTEIDYYHPRIAVWEPLLEPSDVCFMVEWQRGSALRPGQLAVELSDRFVDSADTAVQTSAVAVAPRVISLNLSDAAAEIVVRSIKEWKDWRQRALARQDIDSQALCIAESRGEDESPSQSVFPLSPAAQSESTVNSFGMIPGRFDASSSVLEAKHAAAQKAAKAALVFAQKRGAGTKKKSESSKPFVFRNRTGMSLSFLHEEPNKHEKRLASFMTHAEEKHRPLSQRGTTPTFLADGGDARFHMDVISQEQKVKDEAHNAKRVRAHDGQYPSLCVILEASPGLVVKPLRDLPVFKVGNSIRRLQVRKLQSDTEYSVPVVWTVEIEDNRRVLTLSSAVRVISSGVSLSVDVGVCTSVDADENTVVSSGAALDIEKVGTAQSGSPFYLPLWLALECKTVDVFVKPSRADYNWSKEKILSFVPAQSFGNHDLSDWAWKEAFDASFAPAQSLDSPDLTDWAWKEAFDLSCTVPCEPADTDVLDNTLWLSCVSLPHVGDKLRNKDDRRSRRSRSLHGGRGSLISIAVDAGLTIRNMLPTTLEWELVAFEGADMIPMDSSSNRAHNDATHSYMSKEGGLLGGEAVDVLSFRPGLDIRARFRCYSGQEWSEWAPLSPSMEKNQADLRMNDFCEGLDAMYSTRQVNVQIQDELGVPITVGVRIVPKVTEAQDQSIARCFGYDAIVFAELWLRNLTPLPLSFGCPSAQINEVRGLENSQHSADEAGIINAEAALMEIASILELGERGKGFNLRDDNGSVSTPDTLLLPYQTADLIYDEIFEYVEVENSVIKRRWWASETHGSRREDPRMCEETNKGWSWIDDEWKIDCSGQSLRSSEGWESCRSLIGGKDDFFLRRRMFNTCHPFRRRRWFRRRRARHNTVAGEEELLPGQLYQGINAFHQPINDAFSRAQEHAREIQKRKERHAGSGLSGNGDSHAYVDKDFTKISIRCADGQWSTPCVVPQTGGAHGVIRVPASRWPTLTKLSQQQAAEITPAMGGAESTELSSIKGRLTCASLSPALYELCYKIVDLGEDWGELTRMFLLTPRFMLRNDSKSLSIEVKQSGAPDETAVVVEPGDTVPFFWADFRLPELVSLRPVLDDRAANRKYRWSGGFDVCTLGMTAIRLRRSRLSSAPRKTDKLSLKSIRTLVEIRSGTGGTGINVSFKEEDPGGNGSLFRIENLSPFRIWIAQDGVLANPSVPEERRSRVSDSAVGNSSPQLERRFLDDHARTDGDLSEPGDCTAFALDVPFRQGKYAGRKAASMSELTRIRVGLAPLSSRDGVESTKVVSLSVVGESVRLSPAKLSSISGFDIRTHLIDLRVLGVVTTDGPTRVLRFCMMKKNDASGVFDYTLSNIASSAPFRGPSGRGYTNNAKSASRGKEEYLQHVTLDSAMRAIEMDAPVEDEALRLAFFGTADGSKDSQDSSNDNQVQDDTIFSFRASFCGFSCSLVDKTPSEIALVTLKDVDVSADWNKNRTTDGACLISVGWLQVDNYVPSAPFPVAVCPIEHQLEGMKTVDENEEGVLDSDDDGKPSPLVLVGLTFAPKHKSGILCLRSATIAPRDLAVSVDLAFVVRLQQFFVGARRHFRSVFAKKSSMTDRANSSVLLLQTETRQFIPFPDIEDMIQQLEGANVGGVGSHKFYFQGLNILPCNVNLSVAPARALTNTQASLEGNEAAALHAAVRKGDLLVGGGTLGVHIGHKNKTPVSVVRGVFKSIIVDALLRCESASLNFAGVYLRNHISTGPQLKTFLGAHYMESLKSNVPALLGSMAALGNPLGLIRGIGDGMSDFVNEPVKGLRKSMEELDPSYVVGGVARGTKSLARHAVGGFAGSASLLTETFSKNMAVITLDRRYAQRRDRRNTLRSPDRDLAVTFFEGVESGAVKLVRGVWDGVTGVVRAPLRGAERHGMEGFAKGVGKGLLGLLVKPMIGLSDAATDVMIGVQGSVEGKSSLLRGSRRAQVRPRRPMYGRDRILRPYVVADAAAATLMLRTKLAGENYLSHYDMDDKVALLSVKRMLVLGSNGEELLMVKYKNIEKVAVQPMTQRDGDLDEVWAVVIVLSFPRSNERPVHVIRCNTRAVAAELASQLNRGVSLVNE